MSVVGVADVEAAAGGSIRLGPDDIVTPLARDRAADLDVTFEAATASGNSRVDVTRAVATHAAELRQARRPTSAAAAHPPSGAMYRRGAPEVTARTSVHTVLKPAGRAPKVTVVGAGHVGATTALRLAEADLYSEIVMLDVVGGLAAGLALDLMHSSPVSNFATRVVGTDAPDVLTGSDFVVITAGRARQPGMTRTDLTAINAEIVTTVSRDVARYAPDAIVIVVTNPLDEMTHLAWRETGFPPQRVMGMAGVLDSTRFCALAAEAAGVRPDAVQALALGSHGEEMVIPLSQATLSGSPITSQVDPETLTALVDRARGSGAEVVGLLGTGSAYYAPAASISLMVTTMTRGSSNLLAACVRGDGTYGIEGSFVGLPVRLDTSGIAEIVELQLTEDELTALRTAAGRIADRVAEMSTE